MNVGRGTQLGDRAKEQRRPILRLENASEKVSRVLEEDGSIAGRRIARFFTEGLEGFSIEE